MSDRRDDFLIEMYKQMFNDINRHILVVWQSVGVIVGALAFLSLVEKKVVSLDIATSVIVILCAWLAAHLYDASYWYNRNLVIIANIERQFLTRRDSRDIQYYFTEHRPNNKMIWHLRIQMGLAFGISLLMLGVHFYYQILPGIHLEVRYFDAIRTLPYVVSIVAIGFCAWVRWDRDSSYEEFVTKSPGVGVVEDPKVDS